MLNYILQRVLYTIPVVILVALVTFILFFMFVPPEVMARKHLSAKDPKASDIYNWLQKHGYDKPLFINLTRPIEISFMDGSKVRGAILKKAGGEIHVRQMSGVFETFKAEDIAGLSPVPAGEYQREPWWDSQFFHHVKGAFTFQLGRSDQTGELISRILMRDMWPSLALTMPAFVLSLFFNLSISLYVAFCRGTYVDKSALFGCVLIMSVPTLVYIIAGQWLFSLELRLVPISGWAGGLSATKFLLLPVFLALAASLGGSVRFYRTVILEEINRDYVRTARAKGMGETRILFRDVLKNSLIPMLTSAVLSIPFLIMGNLLLENFFGIPGLGARMINAINASDFSTIRSLVIVGTYLYIVGLLLTDISYTLVNPRIRFEGTPLIRVLQPIFLSSAFIISCGALARGALALKAELDSVQNIRRPWLIENAVVIILVICFILVIRAACKREYWREAFRRVWQDKLAVAALGVVLLYATIAVLDSISWKNKPTDIRPLTVMDRIMKPVKERTYSAPLADAEYREREAKKLTDKHWLGTDSNGVDVLHRVMKGVRTAMILGVFSTLIVVPLAVVMGITAGYFRGWVDDTIQLLYTVLASIPGILLLVSLMIVLGRGLPQLCFALGVTSWVGLCRLIRAETLKLRELEYVQGSQALGTRTIGVLWSHILPNVMHLIVITFVLRFSGLVMSEVTLSYLGIGVAPGTGSWGSMIDGARLELARDPNVWWNFTSAFGAMFFLVLCFNYFGDVLRDALDPRLRDR
ncbi:MAG: ABC transporter permease subunit [Planctomycetota bacterium]|jgi:ABC-type dipeptide/oligopeptide/nickel transport system permease subunit|nr:ABC transporter permease subunit [Planctomycetota bacterium]